MSNRTVWWLSLVLWSKYFSFNLCSLYIYSLSFSRVWNYFKYPDKVVLCCFMLYELFFILFFWFFPSYSIDFTLCFLLFVNIGISLLFSNIAFILSFDFSTKSLYLCSQNIIYKFLDSPWLGIVLTFFLILSSIGNLLGICGFLY